MDLDDNMKIDKCPIAYKRGYQDFYGRDFLVTSDVLIPRPETEQLIDLVLKMTGKPYLPGVKPTDSVLPSNPSILDVGTGSGCIAITLKLQIPEADVSACDFSDEALDIARANARKLGARVDFYKSDLLKSMRGVPDIIVANLPYVDESWEWLDKEALGYEPKMALYAKDGGCEVIMRLIVQAMERNIKFLVLESDPSQHDRIFNFASNYHYQLIETIGYIQRFELVL